MMYGCGPPRQVMFSIHSVSLGLTQCVKGAFVDLNKILDLIRSTEVDRVVAVWVLKPFPKCHHCPVVSEYILQFDIPGNFLMQIIVSCGVREIMDGYLINCGSRF